MTRERLRSWRLFTAVFATLTLLLGVGIGAATTNIEHHTSWSQGYQAGLKASGR